jgi:hypothetical protein
MSIVWDGISALFYFSLVMLAASVFTPKTAWFFREKSRLRGAIIWMSCVVVTGFLTSEFAPGVDVPELRAEANATGSAPASAPVPATPRQALPALPGGVSLPAHEVEIVSALPGERLSLEGHLAGPVDEQSLRNLSGKAIAEKKGQNYGLVLITWYVTGQSREQEPFAHSRYENGTLSVQMEKPGAPAQ